MCVIQKLDCRRVLLTTRSTCRGEIFKSTVKGKVPEGSTIIFGGTRIISYIKRCMIRGRTLQSNVNKRAQVFLFARIFYNITFTYKLKHLRFQLTRNENCKEHLEHLGSLAKTQLDLFSRFDRTEASDGRTDTGGYRTVAYTALA